MGITEDEVKDLEKIKTQSKSRSKCICVRSKLHSTAWKLVALYIKRENLDIVLILRRGSVILSPYMSYLAPLGRRSGVDICVLTSLPLLPAPAF